MIYVSFIYKGTIVETLAFPLLYDSNNVDLVVMLVGSKRCPVPENWERYDISCEKPEDH